MKSKKIIVILNEKKLIANDEDKNSDKSSIFSKDAIEYEQLSEEFTATLLDAKVLFQGEEKRLKDLIPNDKLKDILDSTPLIEFVEM